MTKSKNLLLIFTRNPELGKCKTRLANTVGDESALEIYKFLLKHTVSITEHLHVDKAVYYSVKTRENDLWDEAVYQKHQQHGDDLGMRMHHAFEQGFKDGYNNIIIIGTDMYDMEQIDLERAFKQLESNDVVIGPAEDGGYYLLGMNSLQPKVFSNKEWGTEDVLKDTLKDLRTVSVKLLQERNDVDYYDDIRDIEVFQQFFPKHLKSTVE